MRLSPVAASVFVPRRAGLIGSPRRVAWPDDDNPCARRREPTVLVRRCRTDRDDSVGSVELVSVDLRDGGQLVSGDDELGPAEILAPVDGHAPIHVHML